MIAEVLSAWRTPWFRLRRVGMLRCALLAFLFTVLSLPLPAAETPPSPAPQGYLYVEPYQVRFEALFDAATLSHWLEPNTAPPPTLTPANQNDITEKAAAKTANWCRIAINAEPAANGVFRGASIVKGTPGNTLPLDPGADIATSQAMIGLVWEFATPPIADQVTVEWQGFIQGQTRLPIRVFFGPKSETLELTAEKPAAQWRSAGRMRAPTPLAPVPSITISPNEKFNTVTWAWIGSGVAAAAAATIFTLIRRRRGHHFPHLGLWILLVTWLGTLPSIGMWKSPFATPPATVDAKRAETIVTPLLRNVYRAFDQRTESQIYDVLARSVDGELLRSLYLETIQALTLDGREGTRVTINEFDATVKSVRSQPENATFTADCEWTALGTVGHWGHTHTRVNRYTAKVTVAPIGKEWKIVKLEVQEARRL